MSVTLVSVTLVSVILVSVTLVSNITMLYNVQLTKTTLILNTGLLVLLPSLNTELST